MSYTINTRDLISWHVDLYLDSLSSNTDIGTGCLDIGSGVQILPHLSTYFSGYVDISLLLVY